MESILIMIIIAFYSYYILYKLMYESTIQYILWLLFSGLLVIGLGFVIHFPRRVFYMIESAGLLYLVIVLITVVLHIDILEKIRDYFK